MTDFLSTDIRLYHYRYRFAANKYKKILDAEGYTFIVAHLQVHTMDPRAASESIGSYHKCCQPISP